MPDRIRWNIINDGNERKAWPGLMKECLVEYNRTVHSVTGYPPVYLLHGEEVEVCPIKLEASDLVEARRRAFENIMKNHRENKRRTDKNKIDGEFEVGQQVYVEAGSSTNRNKLARLRTGPFEVEQKTSPLMYRVGAGRRKREANMFHGNQLTRAPARRRALGGDVNPRALPSDCADLPSTACSCLDLLVMFWFLGFLCELPSD